MPNSPEDPADYPWDRVLHRGFRGKSPLPEGWPRNPHVEHQLNRVRAAMTPKEYDEWLPGFLQWRSKKHGAGSSEMRLWMAGPSDASEMHTWMAGPSHAKIPLVLRAQNGRNTRHAGEAKGSGAASGASMEREISDYLNQPHRSSHADGASGGGQPSQKRASAYRFIPKGGATLMPNGKTIDEMWQPVEDRARQMDADPLSYLTPLPRGDIYKLEEAVRMNMPESEYDYKKSLPNVGGWSDREKAANYQYYIMGRRAGVPDAVLRDIGKADAALKDIWNGKWPEFKEEKEDTDTYDRARRDMGY